MKKYGLLLTILLVLTLLMGVVACESVDGAVIGVDNNLSRTLEVGSEVDFTKYFIIVSEGSIIPTTEDMLDLTAVDLTKAGTFDVSCIYSDKSVSITFTVIDAEEPPVEDVIVVSVVGESSITLNVGDEEDFKSHFSITKNGDGIIVTDEMLDLSSVDLTKAGSFTVTCTYSEKSATLNVTVKAVAESNALTDVLESFSDYDSWNFRADVFTYYNGTLESEDFYWYMGQNIKNQYTAIDDEIYVDYIQYDDVNDKYWFIADYLEEGYFKYSEDSDDYYELVSYMYLVDPNVLSYYTFEYSNGAYVAENPAEVGEYFVGEFEDETYTSFTIKLSNGKISDIVAEFDSGYSTVYKFYDYGNVSFEIPDAEEDTSGGDYGDDDDNPSVSGSLTSTFIGADLSVGKGELGYTSNVGANGLDETRGLQFMQSNGKVVLTSKNVVENVTSVTVVVQTNADNGMNVSIKVGDNSLSSDGLQTILVAKSGYQDLKTITFTSSSALIGKVEVTLSPTQTKRSMYILSISINGSSSGGNTKPTETMENQVYNEETFDQENLQDKILKEDGAIGLPSTGDIDVLVIPVQFVGETITQNQIDKLKLAFNGTSSDTGWESVKTFYQKSSYGKLNLSFDFTDIVSLKNNASYYENYSNTRNQNESGSDVILKEALTALDSSIDFSKYDTNGDGCIDAVYIIYSAEVDYTNADFFWAYVTYYPNEETYDNVNPYYYMFAGFDFMDESLEATSPTDVVYPISINTMTYIHETGHLLGLDDYYDYYEELGANEGLGGADMMDYNIGDHGAYSKIMLGWMDATIVTSTQTVTISSLSTKGDCILVPLNFNNSYFSEYLLIDLYSATGLNELESKMDGSYLYDGAEYGVRIYHVSSQINKPCDEDDYYSLTNYNNSITDIALIKLVEADGESKFNSSEGLASSSDLWHSGDKLSEVFSSYTRNDNKLINFDITIVSDSTDSATITITFNE